MLHMGLFDLATQLIGRAKGVADQPIQSGFCADHPRPATFLTTATPRSTFGDERDRVEHVENVATQAAEDIRAQRRSSGSQPDSWPRCRSSALVRVLRDFANLGLDDSSGDVSLDGSTSCSVRSSRCCGDGSSVFSWRPPGAAGCAGLISVRTVFWRVAIGA